MSASHSPGSPPNVDQGDVSETTQLRLEQTQRHREVTERLDRMERRMSSSSGSHEEEEEHTRLARGANNKRVNARDFGVPLGAGAEERDDMQDKWLALLKSDKASKTMTQGFAAAILNHINSEGRDLEVTDHILAQAMLAVAASLGKGPRPRRHLVPDDPGP